MEERLMNYVLVVLLAGGKLTAGQDTCSKPERPKLDDDLRPMYKTRPELDCSSEKIDAATMTKDGKIYFFKGDYYWRVDGTSVPWGYPRLIEQDWDGLPGDLDAALTWGDGSTFFFKGENYWRFTDRDMDRNYPRKISDGFCGVPDDLDAILPYSGNKAYFFKGTQYWFNNPDFCTPVFKNYPKTIQNNWLGVPDDVDAAVMTVDGYYFFKDDSLYKFENNQAGPATNILSTFGIACEDLKCRIPKY